MMQFVVIGISAGAAAALLFASVTSGTLLSVPLFYLAPLPIMIAGLGWSHWAALTAAMAGAIALGIVFGTMFLFAFLTGTGVPAWWLSYLGMLARPVGDNGKSRTLEWYPTGRLVTWAAILAALIVIVAIPNFGTDAESFHAGLRGALRTLLGVESGTATDPSRGVSKIDRLISFLVNVIPPAAAVLATITNLLNLWLAARVVKFSGRLSRPWPQLAAMSFSPLLTVALGLAIALSFVDGMLGIVAGIVSASLLIAYGVLGFAVLHAITQNIGSRGFVLGLAYAAVIVLGWPILALCLLGVVDTAIDLRGRVARKRGPPALS